VYHEKLEKLFDGSVPVPQNIKTLEFGKNNESFFIGTDRGKLYKFSIPNKALAQDEPLEIDEGSINILYRLNGIKDEDMFLVHVANSGVKAISFDN